MTTTLTQLITNMQTCATTAGFSTFKFGKPTSINFDHNITYDLINVDFPQSRILDINQALQIYSFRLILARQITKANTTGVQTLDDVHVIMTALETKLWAFLSCVGAGSNCQDVIPKETIQIVRDKGTFNDNLVTLQVQFSIEVFSDCFEIQC